MGSDGHDVELRSVALKTPLNRTLAKDESDYIEEVVETSKGPVTVATRGDRSKPAILTYHDLGLNYISNFQAFFNYQDMNEILKRFWVVHLNAPGQEDAADTIPDDVEYPSMEDLAELVSHLVQCAIRLQL